MTRDAIRTARSAPRSSRHWLVALIVATAVVLGTVAVALVVRDPGQPPNRGVGSSPSTEGSNCREPIDSAPNADAALVESAPPLEVPGLVHADLGSLFGVNAEFGGDAVWIWLPEPGSDAISGVQYIGRVDPAAAQLTAVEPVVEGCIVSGLAATNDSVWVATCDELGLAGATTGAEVIQLDAETGAVKQRVPIPARCLAEILVAGDSLIAASDAITGDPQRIWRVEPDASVTELAQLSAAGDYQGFVVSADGVWAQQYSGEQRAVLFDPTSGQELKAVPNSGEALIGKSDEGLWFQSGSALIARNSITGAADSQITTEGVIAAAAGESGVFLQSAQPGSATISISRLDPDTGEIETIAQFDAVSLDRSGLPSFGKIMVSDDGFWFLYGGKLYRHETTAE